MKQRVRSDLAFLDMVFNMVLAFALLFVMSFLLIRPPAETKKAVEMKAEFVITLSWPDGALDDQDLWVLMPNGQQVGYAMKDIGVATLDRDDRGGAGNIYIDPASGDVTIQPTRREVTTIRTILPGRYVVNVYTFAAQRQWMTFENPSPMPYEVEVTMMKLNPRVTEVIKRKVLMEKLGSQRTVFAFTVDEGGGVVNVETDVDEPFVVLNKAMPHE